MQLEQFYYDNKIVKQFGIATLFWGMYSACLVGIVTIAFQLSFIQVIEL
jgi:cytochrome c oxidase cbb3-type subunit I/II